MGSVEGRNRVGIGLGSEFQEGIVEVEGQYLPYACQVSMDGPGIQPS